MTSYSSVPMGLDKASPQYRAQYGFALRTKREYPPIGVDVHEWARRTQTRGYIQRIKRSVTQTNAYLLMVRGRTRGVSGHQLDALHYLLDPLTDDRGRRDRRGDKGDNAAPTSSILY